MFYFNKQEKSLVGFTHHLLQNEHCSSLALLLQSFWALRSK